MTDPAPSYIPKPKRLGAAPKVAGIFGARKPASAQDGPSVVIPQPFLKKVQFMEKYTEPLKKYIRDCFGQCANDQARELVSSRLIEKINTLSVQGMLNQHNWAAETLVSPLATVPMVHQPPKPAPPPPPQPVFTSQFVQPQAPPQQWQQYAGWQPYPPQQQQWQQPNQYQQQWQPNQYQQQWQPEVQQQPPPAPVQNQWERQPVSQYAPGQQISAAWQPPKPAPTFEQKVITKNVKLTKKERMMKKKQKQQEKQAMMVAQMPNDVSLEELVQEKQIVGTSTDLEKQYLRLTGDSDMRPACFRPLHILEQSLDYCMAKYENSKDYEYITEQLRSIRQDLTVQHIYDKFCVKVYETHAKLAIEHSDWDNFNQSMNPLEMLYHDFGEFDHICEIGCYRILYLMGVDDLSGLYSFIPKLKDEVRESRMVQFAITVWKVAAAGEWVRYFNLMNEATPLQAGVMSIKAKAVRFGALESIAKAFRQQTLADYKALLFIDSDEEIRKYLEDANVRVPDE